MKNKYIMFFLMFLIFLTSYIYIYIYKYSNEKIEIIGHISSYKIDIDNIYKYNIDNIYVDKDNVVINGWVVKLGNSIDYCDRRVVLIDKSGNIIASNTVMIQKDFVTEYYSDGNYYGHCGFESKFKKNIIIDDYIIGILVKEKNFDLNLVITNSKIRTNMLEEKN